MMHNRRVRAGLFVGLAGTALLAAACGQSENQRAALEQEELARELDLAFRGDTAAPTFQDTANRVVPEPSQPATPAPRPQTPQTTPPRPATPPPAAQPTPQAPPVESPAPTQPAPTPTATRVVPSGTSFAVRLNQTLSTETNQVGDAFTATLNDPIIGGDGSVLIPSGAVVRGRVTAVSKSNHVGETAVIKLAFEAVTFEGRSYPLEATVVDANPERRSRQTAGGTAARAAAGAAAGAIIGQVLGRDTESTVRGAVIGAAAGTAIAMGTADVDAVLPSGSRMVIRLDTPVQVDVAS